MRTLATLTMTVLVMAGVPTISALRTSELGGNGEQGVLGLSASAQAKRGTNESAETDLTAELESIVAKYGGVETGVSIVDISSVAQYDVDSGSRYVAASTTKVITAAYALQQVQNGTLSVGTDFDGQTLAQRLEAMIVDSDNDSWHVLRASFGEQALTAFASQYGADYDVGSNVISAQDMSQFLVELYQGHILEAAYRQNLLDYMARATPGEYLAADTPTNVTVYQKYGWLADRLMVTGLIVRDDKAYAVTIFSKQDVGTYDFATGQSMIADIASLLYT